MLEHNAHALNELAQCICTQWACAMHLHSMSERNASALNECTQWALAMCLYSMSAHNELVLNEGTQWACTQWAHTMHIRERFPEVIFKSMRPIGLMDLNMTSGKRSLMCIVCAHWVQAHCVPSLSTSSLWALIEYKHIASAHCVHSLSADALRSLIECRCIAHAHWVQMHCASSLSACALCSNMRQALS